MIEMFSLRWISISLEALRDWRNLDKLKLQHHQGLGCLLNADGLRSGRKAGGYGG